MSLARIFLGEQRLRKYVPLSHPNISNVVGQQALFSSFCYLVYLAMDFFIYGRNCYIWPAHMRPKKYMSSSKVEMGLDLIGQHVNISLPSCCSWCSLKRCLCVLACGHTRKLESWWRDKHFIVSLICLINLRVLGLVFAHHLAPLRPPSKATM